MNRRPFAIGIVVLSVAALATWYYRSAQTSDAPTFRYATVERTTLEATVAATGTLSAVRTVQVGTQVSGLVRELLVDFNDRVKKGQLLARIDPILQQQAVAESQASLERANAQLTQAKAEYDRTRTLFEAQVVTASEFNAIEATYAVATSNVRSAQIALDRARQNLSYTSIYAPIEGVIVSRTVDIGQTVAASLSAPELFRIAKNLREMQILASVDESDIGKIAVGQPVTFTVAAYAGRTFSGITKQVRLLSSITDNVVNYTVVVGVENGDGKLLPGMTATVKFLTARAPDVLAVSTAALRFTPTAAMLGADSALLTASRRPTTMGDTAARRAASVRRRPGGDSTGTLWVRDSTGTFARLLVRTGLSDGQRTEVRGPNLTEGLQVIVGITTASSGAAATAATSNPFQPTQQGGGAPRPRGAF
ncbi:efflux RND transporter periplasmic adaptor subunit [Gemmatimonas phototrophica]|uniref:efflux RND transporter periplasmic adaptor subunit n=1 Tax=Gemmatimonas phototrophica TaxID=1379270 RepID=UPI0006A6FAE8|nr:efflux RND transporter periplasmic adaptor subunit [Gemmatimonas phototrophica]